MPVVKVLPSGLEFEVNQNESVAEAAWRQGLVWPTKCWGQVDCMSCFTKVVDGELAVIPAAEEETEAMRARMSRKVRTPLIRLGCRLRINGDGVVLEKQGVRPAQASDNNMIGSDPGAAVESGRP